MPKIAPLADDRPTEWLSPRQLADEIGIPLQTLYRWRVDGKGPRGYSVGRHLRFRRADINAWLESQADPA